MRSIREYIKASLSDSSHILYTNTHSVPRGVVDFTFIRAPVKRIADVLSKGFPSGEHVYDLTPRWRVADCSRGVPFAHINGARRESPPAVEAHALHGACDAFEFYIDVSPYYDAGRVAQACGRVELRRVPFFSGLQCFVWTTSLGCAIGGYNLSFRYGAPNPTNPTNPGFWDIL